MRARRARLLHPDATPASPFDLAYILLPAFVLLVGLAVYAWLATRKHRRLEREHEQQLSRLGELSARLGQTHFDPEELAEVAYEEAARFLETDFFQLGLFEEGSYRTLIWIRDYERQDNQAFDLRKESQGLVAGSHRSRPCRYFAAEREAPRRARL
jgi:hypothetical protein